MIHSDMMMAERNSNDGSPRWGVPVAGLAAGNKVNSAGNLLDNNMKNGA